MEDNFGFMDVIGKLIDDYLNKESLNSNKNKKCACKKCQKYQKISEEKEQKQKKPVYRKVCFLIETILLILYIISLISCRKLMDVVGIANLIGSVVMIWIIDHKDRETGYWKLEETIEIQGYKKQVSDFREYLEKNGVDCENERVLQTLIQIINERKNESRFFNSLGINIGALLAAIWATLSEIINSRIDNLDFGDRLQIFALGWIGSIVYYVLIKPFCDDFRYDHSRAKKYNEIIGYLKCMVVFSRK